MLAAPLKGMKLRRAFALPHLTRLVSAALGFTSLTSLGACSSGFPLELFQTSCLGPLTGMPVVPMKGVTLRLQRAFAAPDLARPR